MLPTRSVASYAHGNTHATADAERRQSLLCVPPCHLEQQGVEDPRPGSTDRMAQRNGAAIDVYLFGIPAHVLVDGKSLGRKGLVCLDQVEIVHTPAGLLQCLA